MNRHRSHVTKNWQPDFDDGEGNTIKLQRNAQNVVVGLLAKSPAGHWISINGASGIAEGGKRRDRGPAR